MGYASLYLYLYYIYTDINICMSQGRRVIRDHGNSAGKEHEERNGSYCLGQDSEFGVQDFG